MLNNKGERLKKKQQQNVQSVWESSDLVPLVSNPGIDTITGGFLTVPDSYQGWYSGLCGEWCYPSCWAA
jgi:hypothetical protein